MMAFSPPGQMLIADCRLQIADWKTEEDTPVPVFQCAIFNLQSAIQIRSARESNPILADTNGVCLPSTPADQQ
jgi:hypothetical protein